MSVILVTGGAGFIGTHSIDRMMPGRGRAIKLVDCGDLCAVALKRIGISARLSSDAYARANSSVCDNHLSRLASQSADTERHLMEPKETL